MIYLILDFQNSVNEAPQGKPLWTSVKIPAKMESARWLSKQQALSLGSDVWHQGEQSHAQVLHLL